MSKIDRSTYSKWRETTPPSDPEAGLNAMRALFKRVSSPEYAKDVRQQQREHDARMALIIERSIRNAVMRAADKLAEACKSTSRSSVQRARQDYERARDMARLYE